MNRPLLSLFLLFFACDLAICQVSFDEVDYDLVSFKKIEPYVEKQSQRAHVETFDQLEPSCISITDYSDFQVYEKTYKIKRPLERVWDTYKSAEPTSSWNTKKSKIGLMYEKRDCRIVYPGDTCSAPRIGQVIYLNLKMLYGLYNLVTSVEITELDQRNKSIEFHYVRGGINDGKQIISMREDEKGNTILTHTSMVHSESPFRDKVIYPLFHNGLINAFHKRMRDLIDENMPLESASL